jgi:hypothetical protein
MKYILEIQAASTDPEKMENIYSVAQQANEEAEFRTDLRLDFENSPDNVLLSAWNSRFAHQPMAQPRRVIKWGIAVALGIVTGLILWVISNPLWVFRDHLPYLVLFWAPITTLLVLVFLNVVPKRNYLHAAIAVVGLIILCVYILLITPPQPFLTGQDYLILMIFQLPLLCWIGLGIAVLRFRSTSGSRFAFLTKSIEVMITAGVYLIFGVIFGLITTMMFSALGITLPDIITRLIAAGGFGLIPILAVATMYDPAVPPEAQDFSQGLSKFVFTIMRLLLPLTIIVLIIYIFVIPFNFMAPFNNRDLLIVYNVMQFAIIGLLIGVTPLRVDELSPKLQLWLRRGIIVVAILALLISLYALSAVIYRTVLNQLTLNRTTIIGWNIINIVIFGALVATQLRKEMDGWHERLQNVFSKAAPAYLVWSLLLVIFLPILFR